MQRINVNNLKDTVETLWLRKKQSGSFTPQEFNLAISAASKEMFSKRYGFLSQKMRNPASRTGWESEQKIRDDMHYLLEREYKTVNSMGQADYPEEYVHISSLRYRYYVNIDCPATEDPGLVPQFINIDILSDGRLAERLSAPDRYKPTKKHPIAQLFGDEYIQVYPTDLQRIEVNYLRMPITPVWGYTGTGNSKTYDPTTSTDFDWPEQVEMELALIVLRNMGIAIREQEITQYAIAMEDKQA